MHVHPSLRITLINESAVDLRLPRGHTVRLEALTPQEHHWLAHLLEPNSNSLDRPVSGELDSLITQLTALGAIRKRPWAPQPEVTGAGAKDWLALRSAGIDPAVSWTRRKATAVAFRGLNPASPHILESLAESGISRFIFDDSITSQDQLLLVGTNNGDPQETSALRAQMRHILASSFPDAQQLTRGDSVQLAILGGYTPAHLMDSLILQSWGIAHIFLGLGVGAAQGNYLVGPLVLPGESKCLNCHASDTILMDRGIVENNRAAGHTAPGSPLSARISGDLVAAAVIQLASGLDPSLHGEVIQVDPLGRLQQLLEIKPDPLCQCVMGRQASATTPVGV